MLIFEKFYFIHWAIFHEDYFIFSKRERLSTLGKSCNGFPSIGKTPLSPIKDICCPQKLTWSLSSHSKFLQILCCVGASVFS